MNRKVFPSPQTGFAAPKATTTNRAGGLAYQLSPEAALAQLAATCTFGGSFYTKAEEELAMVLDVAKNVSSDFVAKTAVFARQRGYMKDMPALLCCLLMTRGDEGLDLLTKVFPAAIDNGRMLRGFMKILRSNVTGRHNVGSRVRKLIHEMFDRVPAHVLFRWSVGNDPSLVDVIKMVHPKPKDAEKDALFGYLLGKKHTFRALPALVQQFEAFKEVKAGRLKAEPELQVPAVPFQMLDGIPEGLTADEWMSLFRTGGWHFVRMNLNTAKRHGVLDTAANAQFIANRLRDAEAIHKSKVFPYQLLTAYKAAAMGMPTMITNALHDALEISLDNVPSMDGSIAVCIDTSGSMGCPVTGHRGTATTATTCVDVAGLVAAALLRKNPDGTTIVPFDTSVKSVLVDPRDTVMTNARKLALRGGGTNCACALQYLNAQGHKGDLVVYVSDNEAWAESVIVCYSCGFAGLPGNFAQQSDGYRDMHKCPSCNAYAYDRCGGTKMAEQWAAYKRRNPKAKLVNINVVANQTTQIAEGTKDTYQIGGFSDMVFTLISEWLAGKGADHWVETIKSIDLDALGRTIK